MKYVEGEVELKPKHTMCKRLSKRYISNILGISSNMVLNV